MRELIVRYWTVGRPYVFTIGGYFFKTVFPIFLASFLFSGALLAYSSDQTLGKSIFDEQIKPAKAQYRECHQIQNKMYMDEAEDATTTQAMANEIARAMTQTTRSQPVMLQDAYMKGMSDQMLALQKLTADERQQEIKCYDELVSDLQDIGITLQMTDRFNAYFDSRSKQFNKLEADRTANPVHLDTISNAFYSIMNPTEADTEAATAQKANLTLSQAAADEMNLVQIDERICKMEADEYVKLMNDYLNAYSTRYNHSMWRYIFG